MALHTHGIQVLCCTWLCLSACGISTEPAFKPILRATNCTRPNLSQDTWQLTVPIWQQLLQDSRSMEVCLRRLRCTYCNGAISLRLAGRVEKHTLPHGSEGRRCLTMAVNKSSAYIEIGMACPGNDLPMSALLTLSSSKSEQSLTIIRNKFDARCQPVLVMSTNNQEWVEPRDSSRRSALHSVDLAVCNMPRPVLQAEFNTSFGRTIKLENAWLLQQTVVTEFQIGQCSTGYGAQVVRVPGENLTTHLAKHIPLPPDGRQLETEVTLMIKSNVTSSDPVCQVEMSNWESASIKFLANPPKREIGAISAFSMAFAVAAFLLSAMLVSAVLLIVASKLAPTASPKFLVLTIDRSCVMFARQLRKIAKARPWIDGIAAEVKLRPQFQRPSRWNGNSNRRFGPRLRTDGYTVTFLLATTEAVLTDKAILCDWRMEKLTYTLLLAPSPGVAGLSPELATNSLLAPCSPAAAALSSEQATSLLAPCSPAAAAHSSEQATLLLAPCSPGAAALSSEQATNSLLAPCSPAAAAHSSEQATLLLAPCSPGAAAHSSEQATSLQLPSHATTLTPEPATSPLQALLGPPEHLGCRRWALVDSVESCLELMRQEIIRRRRLLSTIDADVESQGLMDSAV